MQLKRRVFRKGTTNTNTYKIVEGVIKQINSTIPAEKIISVNETFEASKIGEEDYITFSAIVYYKD